MNAVKYICFECLKQTNVLSDKNQEQLHNVMCSVTDVARKMK